MNDATLMALLKCDNEKIVEWFNDAIAEQWSDLDDIAQAAMEVHGELVGFWRCDHCECPLLDPAVAGHAGASGEATMLGAFPVWTTLCDECYEAAKEARAKIQVVIDDDVEYDDDSALSDEERTLAGYIGQAIDAQCRADRDLIRGYPRHEQRQLHRYQDSIDADRRRSGKSDD